MAENGEISITLNDLKKLNSYRDLEKVIGNKHADASRIIQTIEYEHELEQLQIELLKAQQWIRETGQRVAILFEGRDAAGKGGTIRRFTQHLNPRSIRIVALPAPSSVEKGQWYFQRYIQRLPNPGEMVFFDRSWYNRAVVEPVNGFCSQVQYQQFMQQVPEFEHMLYEDGVILIKFWFSISKDEQLKRFESRKENPLKQWKLSPVDAKAQDLWDEYTRYKEEMFNRTHTSYSPWIIVKANSKKKARNESIRHVLNTLPYPEKEHTDIEIYPNPDVVTRYHRQIRQLDE
ncbi:MAG: polyphosphate kinase 2 [Bacteroidota bacterium]